MNINFLNHLIRFYIDIYIMADAIFIENAMCQFNKYPLNNKNKYKGPSKITNLNNFASLILSNFFLSTRAFYSLYSFNSCKNSIYEN
jgi:hypothetical protein